MSKHTQGPWEVSEDDLCEIESADGRFVAMVLPAPELNWNMNAEREANARLIAAAPDLLAALQLVLVADSISPGDCYNPDGSPNKLWGSIDEAKAAARAAIAKATRGDL